MAHFIRNKIKRKSGRLMERYCDSEKEGKRNMRASRLLMAKLYNNWIPTVRLMGDELK